jgi:hypothetical protein
MHYLRFRIYFMVADGGMMVLDWLDGESGLASGSATHPTGFVIPVRYIRPPDFIFESDSTIMVWNIFSDFLYQLPEAF